MTGASQQGPTGSGAEWATLEAERDALRERTELAEWQVALGLNRELALRARVEELENIDRIGDLEDSLGRALAEANQLAARVEELEAELAEAYRESREWQAERDRAAIYVPVGVDLSSDRKAGS